MWSDLVEELSVALGLDAEGVAVVDLEPVEVLVLERAEGALKYELWPGLLRRVRMWISSGRRSI